MKKLAIQQFLINKQKPISLMSKEIKEQKQKLMKGLHECLQLKKIFSDGIDQVLDQWLSNLDYLESAQEKITQNSKLEKEMSRIKSLNESFAKFDAFRIKLSTQIQQFSQTTTTRETPQFSNLKTEKSYQKTSQKETVSKMKYPQFTNEEVGDDSQQCLLCRKKTDKQLGPLFLIRYQYVQYPIHQGCAFWTRGIFYSEKQKYIYLKNKKSIVKSQSEVLRYIKNIINKSCTICNQVGATIRCQKCKLTIVHFPCMMEKYSSNLDYENHQFTCCNRKDGKNRSRSRNDEDNGSNFFILTNEP